jgi:hypothetical protein
MTKRQEVGTQGDQGRVALRTFLAFFLEALEDAAAALASRALKLAAAAPNSRFPPSPSVGVPLDCLPPPVRFRFPFGAVI